MKQTVVTRIDRISEEFDSQENKYLDVDDDVRIHVYYDEDGWVWDAIEGDYITFMSEESFETVEEAEADAKSYIENQIGDYETPEKEEGY